MLWFRLAAVVCLISTTCLSFGIGVTALILCLGPGGDRSMDTDPYYNGTLFFYILVIFIEIGVTIAAAFGFIVAFRVWKNNHQLDHKLRHLFTLWLASLSFTTFAAFIIGILGLVRFREPQEEITTLFEIFSKYSQDVKFVGSFERIQREHSCCGINGPEDWYTAQFKTSGTSGMGSMGMGMDMSFMGIGSPSTGKCHLTPPTIPMGCGKKLREMIAYTQAIYSSVIVLQTLFSIAAIAFSWYCFFYWIEKEVVIIPEDELSNLIVIEPESSASTIKSGSTSISVPSSWSGSGFPSQNGNVYSMYSRPPSRSRYSRLTEPSTRNHLDSSRYTQSRYTGSRSYYPNSRRHADMDHDVTGLFVAPPSVGGPHVAYHYPDRSDAAETINHNSHIQQQYSYNYQQDPSNYYYSQRSRTAMTGRMPPPSQYYNNSRVTQGPDHRNYHSQVHNHELHEGQYGRAVHQDESYRSGHHQHEGRYLSPDASGGVDHHHHHEHVHKEHSKNHMMHKQEKALGGKVLAEMHIDHARDPDPLNSEMDTAKGGRGHRAHHATVVIVKNKKAPKPKTIHGKPEKGHGQTGHLAEDIMDMSGAAAVKSLIDDINLPVEHNAHLGHEGYVNKLHKAKKKKSQLDHPDPDHPGHGALHKKGGKISAPSIDGSQAQSLMDNLLQATKPKKKSEPEIKPHDVEKQANHHHEHHQHHSPHNHGHHSQSHHNHGHHSQSHHNHGHQSHHSHHNDGHHSHHQHHDHADVSHYRNESLRTEVIFKHPNSDSI